MKGRIYVIIKTILKYQSGNCIIFLFLFLFQFLSSLLSTKYLSILQYHFLFLLLNIFYYLYFLYPHHSIQFCLIILSKDDSLSSSHICCYLIMIYYSSYFICMIYAYLQEYDYTMINIKLMILYHFLHFFLHFSLFLLIFLDITNYHHQLKHFMEYS